MAQPGALLAAIYDRASKDRRGTRKSVADQRVANEAACEAHQWQVAEVYTDNHQRASRFAEKPREDWERLAADLDEALFQVLVLWEPSRGDRELEMWARLLNSCRRHGVLIHITSHDRTYDVRKARDWRALAEDGVDSAYESEKISERTKRGLRSNAAEGRPHGKQQYGFMRLYNPRTGHLEGQRIDDQERPAFAPACVTETAWVNLSAYSRAGVVRELATRFAAGEALHGISLDFNRRGIPAPEGGKWMGPQLRVLIQRPAFIGRRMHHGREISAPEWFPPILSDELFYACQSKLQDPQRSGKRDYSVKHLLSGLAVCGVCGEPVRSNAQPGRSPRYGCKARRPDGGASYHVVRNQARVDMYIERVAIVWLAQPEPLEVLSVAQESQGELQEVMDLVADAERRLEGFYDQAAVGELSSTGMSRIEAKIFAEIAELNERARRLRGRFMPTFKRLGNHVDAERQWAAWSIPQRRAFLAELFEKIEIMKVGAGRHAYTDEESIRLTWRT